MFDWFSDDTEEESAEEKKESMRKENIRSILEDYHVNSYSSGMDTKEFGHVSSREYQEYQETEEENESDNRYIQVVNKLAFFEMELGDTQEKLDDAVRLMSWDLNTKKVLPAALVIFGATLMIPFMAALMDIPTVFKMGAFGLPAIALYYVTHYPIFQAQRKVITASDDLILSILYMVVYMRNSPNIEGAVRFAALNTDGEVSLDLKRVLWETEVGNYTSVEEALIEYARRWRPYNKDFIQSIEMLVEAMAESNADRRDKLLGESINNLLEGTQEKMKRYARNLRMPVSATFGIGVLLPVLGMILFPLIASFMGGEGLAMYLSFTYNLFLPILLYFIVRQTLIKRPPTLSTQNVESNALPDKGKYYVDIAGRTIGIPAAAISAVIFLVLGSWPLYFYTNVLLGNAQLPPHSSQGVNGITMLRSLLMTMSVSLSIGSYYYLGNVQRIKKLEQVDAIETEFPESLFQLGNALSRGNPIETGVQQAIDNMRQLEIAEMFRIMAYNMNEIGMTFEDAIFDRDYGALREYPSSMIESVMRALTESSYKGTQIVAQAMLSISEYLKNISQTEEQIQEVLSETLSTMSFMAFVLGPVISGVALGMGTIITKAFYALKVFSEENFNQLNQSSGGGSSSGNVPGGGSSMSTNPMEIFNLENSVPPDILQLVIGLYLIQLALIIGVFYTRLTEGENPVIRKMFTGKILIVMPILYAITTLILVVVFGGMITAQIVTSVN